MKMLFVSCSSVVLLLSLLSPVNAIQINPSTPAPCSTSGTICAELGQTNMCKLFPNECAMNNSNSNLVNAQFDTVAASVCAGLSPGQGRLCDPEFTTTPCEVTATDCTSTNNVCAKMGNINIYRKFANLCRMQQTNCKVENVQYVVASDTFCIGLPVNSQRIVP